MVRPRLTCSSAHPGSEGGGILAKTFDFTNPPFDRLRPMEVARVDRAVDVVFFRAGHKILQAGQQPDHLYVVIKGLVDEKAGDEVVTVHESGDAFDATILVNQRCRHDFVVREEVICYALPIEDFLDLVANNNAFAAFFYRDLGHKLDALAQRQAAPQALSALTLRVDRSLIHEPVRVPASTTLHEAALRMETSGQVALLVEDGERTGIATVVDLTRGAVRDRLPVDTPISEVTRWEVLGIDEGTFVFEAALAMARHKVRHLAVRRDGKITGLIDAAALLRSMAGQADALGAAIAQAGSVEELVPLGDDLVRLIRHLHETGTKLPFLTQLSSDLHRQLVARTWMLLASEDLRARACPILMGSEGRGEYLLRTDQDNGLILEDGEMPAETRSVCARVTEALIEIGFPACPGEIMLRNPDWAMPLGEWRRRIRTWVIEPSEQALMNVAIFVDAAPVAGRADLLAAAKAELRDAVAGNQAFLARFARAIDLFDTPLGLFGRMLTEGGAKSDALDLKKGGIFPLMHGVRALALEAGLEETNTLVRIRRLQDAGVLEASVARDVGDAYGFLSGLRLSTRLEKIRLHEPLDNLVRPAQISKLERDLLKDSLLIVKAFKERIRHHFRLSMF
jgi:CBS domain-containing protein